VVDKQIELLQHRAPPIPVAVVEVMILMLVVPAVLVWLYYAIQPTITLMLALG
jgi:hypothetical protein